MTSWSWRLVTKSQISFHLSWLHNIRQLSNMYVNLVQMHVKIEGILVLLQFHTMAWRHIVTSWRDVVTCLRQLAKLVSMIFLIPTTQISIEFVWKSLFGSTRRSVSDVGWWKYWRDVTTWRYDVTSLHKWKISNIFELSDLKNHGNKKRINFLAHLQAEICIVRFCDVMT